MERIEELEHTADVGFRLEADSPEGLFLAAAEGLRRALGHEASRGRPEIRSLRAEKPDRERLLVAWLRELLAQGEALDAVPEPMEVRLGRGPDGVLRLDADVRWHPRGEGGARREIKGVTYHGLEVGERDGRWFATVVFDV